MMSKFSGMSISKFLTLQLCQVGQAEALVRLYPESLREVLLGFGLLLRCSRRY